MGKHHVEIRRGGNVVRRVPIDESKIRSGVKLRLGGDKTAHVKAGETVQVGEYELKIVAEEVPASPGQSAAVPRLDGYEITGKLGEGGMGVVWRGIQLSTKRPVAIKFLGTRAFGSEKAQRRFEREVELSAKLEHPGIAHIYDSGIRHGVYFYAMELIDGLPLDQYVKTQNLDQKQILEMIKTICQAVQHAHERGVIHRDLKPGNILVARDGKPHVLDFGMAKSLSEEAVGEKQITISVEGTAAGTPAYMSPEQAAGQHEQIDGRTDIYSLGVILYRLLVGESPHDLSGSRWDLMRRITQEEIRSPRQFGSAVNADLEGLLRKALAKNPDDRYATAGDFARDIDNYLQGRPLIARKATFFYLLGKRAARHLIAIPVIIALGMVTAVTVWGALPGGWIRQRLGVTHTVTITGNPIVQRVFIPATAPAPAAASPVTQPVNLEPTAAGFSFVDAGGNPLIAGSIPGELRLAIIDTVNDPQNKMRINKRNGSVVLARILLPAEEKDLTFGSELISRFGTGPMHDLSPGGGTLITDRRPLRNAVWAILDSRDDDCALEVAKMGYKTVRLDVPSGMSGRIIWMGDIKMVRFTGQAGVVRGAVCLPDGRSLDVTGDVSIRINGPSSRNRVPLTKGSFVFRNITPGKYLVEFGIKGYSVKPWFVTVPEQGEAVNNDFIAYELSTLDINLHVDGVVRQKSVQCGVAPADVYLDISPNKRLRLDQSGNTFELCFDGIPMYDIAVLHAPFVDMQTVALATAHERLKSSFWRGAITDGDMIVLRDDNQAGEAVVTAVAEIVKVHNPPPATTTRPSSQPTIQPTAQP